MSQRDHSLPTPRGSPVRQQRFESITSTSSQSSKSSSTYTANSMHYPSGTPSWTAMSSETPSIAAIHDMDEYANDQFGIIDSLDYDDVDDGLIDHELVHQKREMLVQQLHASEHAYLESLNLTMRVFLQPLQKDSKQSSLNFLGMKKMVCTQRELHWLFGNFTEIVQAHQEIFAGLEQRLRMWGPTQIISDVFQTWFPLLKVYDKYLDNYDVSVTTYERLTRYQPFKKFIDSAHKDPALKGATLLSLLQIPVGCITRYAQLIPKLADVTSPMHPDYAGLLKCKQWILSIADDMKPKIDDADNVDQVLMIHQALIGAPFGVKAQRRLILQGQLSRVIMRSTGEERTYLLFSDLLAFVRPKQDNMRTVLQYKGHIVLERARVRPLPAEEADGQEYRIEITPSIQGVDTLNTTFVSSPTVHVLHTSSKEEQEEWLKQLTIVIEKLDREARERNLAQSRRLAHSRSPPNSVRRMGTVGSSGSSKASFASSDSTGSDGRPRY